MYSKDSEIIPQEASILSVTEESSLPNLLDEDAKTARTPLPLFTLFNMNTPKYDYEKDLPPDLYQPFLQELFTLLAKNYSEMSFIVTGSAAKQLQNNKERNPNDIDILLKKDDLIEGTAIIKVCPKDNGKFSLSFENTENIDALNAILAKEYDLFPPAEIVNDIIKVSLFNKKQPSSQLLDQLQQNLYAEIDRFRMQKPNQEQIFIVKPSLVVPFSFFKAPQSETSKTTYSAKTMNDDPKSLMYTSKLY